MTILAIEDSQRTAAKVAGFAYLITLVIVMYVTFGIHFRLIVGGFAEPGLSTAANNAETARNILAHERLFRIGIAADLLYCAGVIVLLTALYVILRPVNRGLALLAAFWRLVWVVMWLVMTLNLLDGLRLLRGADYLQERTQALAGLYLSARFDYYYVALLFGGLASTVCAWLWFKSRYIPRALAVFGVISSAFCVVCTIVFFIFPGFDKIVTLGWFDSPMGFFDIALSLWLLFKGLRPQAASAARAQNRAA